MIFPVFAISSNPDCILDLFCAHQICEEHEHFLKLAKLRLATSGSFISIYTMFAQVLLARMASHFSLQEYLPESVANKSPRMYSGF